MPKSLLHLCFLLLILLPMTFTVDLPVKPYVKAYIESTFGNPANLAKDPEAKEQWRRCLSKPSKRFDSRYKDFSFARYSAIATILITEDDFYRHGCELSKTDIIAFGKFMERRAKFLMRTVVNAYMLIMKKRDAILKFQQGFGYSEDSWPFDSIKKDFDRSAPGDMINLAAGLTETMERIILANLSKFGTILPGYLTNPDQNKKTA